MIKELKSFSPCEIMSCSRQHHKMSPDTPRPQRAAPRCLPRARQGCRRCAAGPSQLDRRGEPGRTGPEQCRRPGEQQCRRRAALDFYRGLGGREGRKPSDNLELARALTGRGPPRASRELWPRGSTFYKPLCLGVAALCAVRGNGDPSRCKSRRVGGCRPGFCF